jgi:bacterioferritin
MRSAIVCVLRYPRHYFMATGIHAHAVAQEFLRHEIDEQEHADLIAARITQLGDEPDVSPAGLLTRSHSEYIEGKDLLDMIREELMAERLVIDSYGEMIRYFGNADPTSRRLIEKILAKEEEHAEDLKALIETLGHDERTAVVTLDPCGESFLDAYGAR